MNKLEYKGYLGSVEYSSEDECFFGKVQGLTGDLISYEGESVSEIKADFEAAIDSYLESCATRGVKPRKPYSGSFNVRISSELHCKAALLAEMNSRTLNALIGDAIADYIKKVEQPVYIVIKSQDQADNSDNWSPLTDVSATLCRKFFS